VIASTQPLFASPDATVLQNFAVLLGPERASHADSFRGSCVVHTNDDRDHDADAYADSDSNYVRKRAADHQQRHGERCTRFSGLDRRIEWSSNAHIYRGCGRPSSMLSG